MSVLCSTCQMRPAHRVWESGRGKCGACYALDPSAPPAAAQRTPRTQKLGAELREVRRRVEEDRAGAAGAPPSIDAEQPPVRRGGQRRVTEAVCEEVVSPDEVHRGGEEGKMPRRTDPAKKAAVLREARSGRWTCRELAERHGLPVNTLYGWCAAAGIALRRGKRGPAGVQPGGAAVQARAQGPARVARASPEAGASGVGLAKKQSETKALARVARGVARLAVRPNGEILVALTARTSALLWSGVASLPLAEQAELLRKLEL